MVINRSKERHIVRTTVHGNPNVGLCGYTTEKYCLIGAEFTKEQAKEIESILKVPVHRISICGTSLIGVFIAGNSTCLLVPSIAFDYELRVLDKLKINYEVLPTELTALGNNILCNDNGAVINPDFKDADIKIIKDALKIPVEKGKINGLNTVGVMATISKELGIINRDVKKSELDKIEKLLKIEFTEGTVNMGTPQIRSGLFCNSNGFVIGESSSGPEINNVDEGLGFLR